MTVAQGTPRTTALHAKYLCEGQFTPDMPELGKKVYWDCIKELVAAEAENAALSAQVEQQTELHRRSWEMFLKEHNKNGEFVKRAVDAEAQVVELQKALDDALDAAHDNL